jgi:putative ABC transport system substrate-binding protein
MLWCVLPVAGVCSEPQQARAIVIFPEMRQPYARVFEEIILGIDTSFSGRLELFAVGDNDSELGPITSGPPPDLLIALGNRGYELAKRASNGGKIPVVLAGVSGDIDASLPGISLQPDPAVVFDRLRLLAPEVKTVYVLVRRNNGDHYKKLVREAGASDQLAVELHECNNFRECAETVRIIKTHKLNRRSALWLAEPEVIDNSILDLILEGAWRQQFVVVSSNPAHVRRGVLFALYPNNVKMGETLGAIANEVVSDPAAGNGLSPVTDVNLAVNMRTASHIGLIFDRQVRSQIHLTFPAD